MGCFILVPVPMLSDADAIKAIVQQPCMYGRWLLLHFMTSAFLLWDPCIITIFAENLYH